MFKRKNIMFSRRYLKVLNRIHSNYASGTITGKYAFRNRKDIECIATLQKIGFVTDCFVDNNGELHQIRKKENPISPLCQLAFEPKK